ncbi:MAG: general secretion pathway protein GspK [Nitrospinota bacterium]|nr:general secretion pathway protein GspK [Nitrospinota bacterium]
MRRILSDQKGIALAIVIWLLVLLAVLSSELVASVKGDVRAVANFSEDRGAYYLAYAGVQLGIGEILRMHDFTFESEEAGLVFGKGSEENIRLEPTRRENIPLGDGYVSYRIEDENRKLNLNVLAKDPVRFSLLFAILFSEGEVDIALVVDSILDWVDADELSRPNGAESDYYASLPDPYEAKNSEFDTLNELRRVRGISESVYQTLAKVLTVYPATGINVNTASPEALFVSGKNEAEIDEIMSFREMNGFASLVDKSDVFTIVSSGRFTGNKMAHHIRAVVKRLPNGNIVILDWTDDYYGEDFVPAISESSEGGRVGGE